MADQIIDITVNQVVEEVTLNVTPDIIEVNVNSAANDLTKVPYTGATQSVNLGSNNITANSFIKSGGLSTQYLKADGSVSTLTNPITGSLSTNYLPKATGATTLGNSLIYDDGTNVGIGTTSPDNASGYTTLSINGSSGGQFTFQTGSSKKGYIYNTSSSLVVGADTGNNLIFDAGASERMRITSGGNVGIGTTAPSTKFNIWNSITAINSKGSFAIESGDVFSSLYMGISDVGSSSYPAYIQSASRNTMSPLSLFLNPNGGNVGIGTTAPTSKLHVSGLPSYADNTTALAGGLTVGAFYHTAGVLKVVI